MRMMMKAEISAEAGNQAVRDGILKDIIGEFTQSFHPEALYFITENGNRTAIAVFDMTDNAQMVQAAEPFFMRVNAKVTWTPCMNSEDLGRGLKKLG